MTDAISKAKDTLLRALDELEAAQSSLETGPDRVDLIVVYSIGSDLGNGCWDEIGGWASTSGPRWVFRSLLKRAAKAFKEDSVAINEEPEDDKPDTFGSA